jgi:starch phosphorylase
VISERAGIAGPNPVSTLGSRAPPSGHAVKKDPIVTNHRRRREALTPSRPVVAASPLPGPAPADESIRTGFGEAAIAAAVWDNLHYGQAVPSRYATRHDWYMALAMAVRDRLLERYLKTIDAVLESRAKVVAYLSAEFLMGPHLGNNLINLGIRDAAAQAVSSLGQNLDELLEEEEEPGLGNGGLGRLAACYMDSLATLGVPAIGYGIRYEFGIFDQAIQQGWQVEKTDKWLRLGNPWEIPRPERDAYDVGFGGRTEHFVDADGRSRVRWVPERSVKGIAYDTPVSGFRSPTANLLRLWKAEATDSFDFDAFNTGDYYGAVEEKVQSETITKVLYPNDEPEAGKQLRLAQQFFFVSCSLQDMIRLLRVAGRPLTDFSSCWAVQLNDTHPAIAIAELMRLLVDEHGLDWDAAWALTERSCAYTNHTLLAEALERWPVELFGKLLPRHLEIIYEINRRFLESVRRRVPGDDELVRRVSLIDESGGRYVRMAHVASVGSHAVNGVAALHSDLLRTTVLRDFYALSPEKFLNITNGVTPRRWIALSNPGLAGLLTRRIGDGWMSNLEAEVARIEPLATDPDFREEWRLVKAANKRGLASLIRQRTGVTVDPESLFDVQVKRIHEYKRQHLNVLYLITAYNRIARGKAGAGPPRTVIFGGKAAPGYRMAKLIIRLIHGVADVINNDPRVSPLLKVVFFPDFNVKNAHHVYPAAELSEQISTAGKEASGTGNMKFAMNGALTIGTLDGANIEIREAVGPDNFFLFGLTAAEVAAAKSAGYCPGTIYESNLELHEAIELIDAGEFSNGDRDLFRPLVESLLVRDEYLLFADYQAYVDCQQRVGDAYLDRQHWTRMSILNCARVGRFSSDRSVREYCRQIWNVEPVAGARGER